MLQSLQIIEDRLRYLLSDFSNVTILPNIVHYSGDDFTLTIIPIEFNGKLIHIPVNIVHQDVRLSTYKNMDTFLDYIKLTPETDKYIITYFERLPSSREMILSPRTISLILNPLFDFKVLSILRNKNIKKLIYVSDSFNDKETLDYVAGLIKSTEKIHITPVDRVFTLDNLIEGVDVLFEEIKEEYH